MRLLETSQSQVSRSGQALPCVQGRCRPIAGEIPRLEEVPDLGPALDLDRVALLRGLGNADSGGLLPTLVDAFSGSAPALARSIGEAAGRREWPTVRAQAHQLAGAAGNIGALAASTLARTIERHAADGREAPGDVGDRLAAEVDRAVDLLTRSLQRAG